MRVAVVTGTLGGLGESISTKMHAAIASSSLIRSATPRSSNGLPIGAKAG